MLRQSPALLWERGPIVAALLVLSALSPGDASLAHADAVCGPWLRVTGQESGPGWSAPICTPEDDSKTSGATPGHYIEYVLHPDTTAIWIAAGYPGGEAAHEAAFKACTEALGEGCYGAVGVSGDVFLGFAQDAQGNTAIGGGHSKAQAEASALAACHQGEPLIAGSCRFIDGVRNTASPRNVFPVGLPLRVFAAVAVPKDAPQPGAKWAGTAWLATGIQHGDYKIVPARSEASANAAQPPVPQGGIEAAQAAALARCAKETGAPCAISNVAYSTGDGLIARYASEKNTLYVGVPSPEAARELEQQFASDGLGLSLTDTFAARPQRVEVIKSQRAAESAPSKAPPKKPPQRRPQASSKRTMSSSPR
ncbi:MAG: DUF4189 domain-containing protein [Azonexus sp.]|nr:DUF4189 domain-containing protein [Azonexus sp.]